MTMSRLGPRVFFVFVAVVVIWSWEGEKKRSEKWGGISLEGGGGGGAGCTTQQHSFSTTRLFHLLPVILFLGGKGGTVQTEPLFHFKSILTEAEVRLADKTFSFLESSFSRSGSPHPPLLPFNCLLFNPLGIQLPLDPPPIILSLLFPLSIS